MSFVSLEFLILLVLTFTIYWALDWRKQNVLLLGASYVFYGWWDWRFLSLIITSTLVDYLCGLGLGKEERPARRKALLMISLATNLGLLGFFKYFNFFVESGAELLQSIGFEAHHTTLRIVLPVGISFYTFQTLSYTIDLYRRKLTPTRDFFQFATFVAFFPQLVAGPIERASHLLGQFGRPRVFNTEQAKDGIRQILWGYVKKVVVADNLSSIVALVYGDIEGSDGGALSMATVMFAFQIYGDFSGYSDIAIGTARLFGIDLMRNFAFPYFARDMAEFWHRWHISLSTWFRDYVYIPLGGNRVGSYRRFLNVMITFTVSGFWHGAAWTFVVWGALNGLLVYLWHKGAPHKAVPGSERLRDIPVILFTFAMTTLAWVFFRAQTIGEAWQILHKIFGDFSLASFLSTAQHFWFYIIPLIIVEWVQRKREHALQIEHLPLTVRWVIYLGLVYTILMVGRLDAYNQFIYFQF